jgi:hypothetical protein
MGLICTRVPQVVREIFLPQLLNSDHVDSVRYIVREGGHVGSRAFRCRAGFLYNKNIYKNINLKKCQSILLF